MQKMILTEPLDCAYSVVAHRCLLHAMLVACTRIKELIQNVTYIHDKFFGFLFFNDAGSDCPKNQQHLPLSSPGNQWTLVRTRLFIEFRVVSYSQNDSGNPPDFWWQGMQPVVGVWNHSGDQEAPQSPLPIPSANDSGWIIWDGLHGELESSLLTPGGHRFMTYVWRHSADVLESRAQRKAGPTQIQSVWLAWSFNDPANVINRSHSTFTTVFDLTCQYAVDFLWKQHPM